MTHVINLTGSLASYGDKGPNPWPSLGRLGLLILLIGRFWGEGGSGGRGGGVLEGGGFWREALEGGSGGSGGW